VTRNGTNTSASKGVHARVTDIVRAHTFCAPEQPDVHVQLEGERDAIPARVFAGTSEIQRNNIIARALGLGG
jgi:hypothetical protein